MNKPPAFQIYARDEITDYPGLSLSARGAFLLLRCRCWLLGGVPSTPAELARLALCSPAEFRRIWPEIRSYFKKRGASYVCPTLRAQREEQIARRGNNSVNGQLGAAVRWGPRPVEARRYNTGLIYKLADAEFFKFLESGTRPEKELLFKSTTEALVRYDVDHDARAVDNAIVSVFRNYRKRQSRRR